MRARNAAPHRYDRSQLPRPRFGFERKRAPAGLATQRHQRSVLLDAIPIGAASGWQDVTVRLPASFAGPGKLTSLLRRARPASPDRLGHGGVETCGPSVAGRFLAPAGQESHLPNRIARNFNREGKNGNTRRASAASQTRSPLRFRLLPSREYRSPFTKRIRAYRVAHCGPGARESQ